MNKSLNPIFSLTTDIVIHDCKNVLLVEREVDPFKGRLALIGGFVYPHIDILGSAVRIVAEKIEVNLNEEDIKYLTILDNPERDTRGRVVSIVYSCQVNDVKDFIELTRTGIEVSSVCYKPLADLARQPNLLAFDHIRAINALRKKIITI